MAKCPAHGDRTASLSVRVSDDGRILLHDFGGCTFREIVATLGLEPQQLFPARDRPSARWRRRPDPDLEARALLERLCRLQEAPPPERLRKELRLVGQLLLGGTAAFAELPPTFRGDSFRSTPLRLLFFAMAELAKQGTPRRWFSPLALAREVELVGGRARRADIFFWRRVAIGAARWKP